MGFSLRVAWRFSTSAKSQTIFIILGIAIGVSVQVFVGSLIMGLQQTLIQQTIGNSPDVTIASNSSNSFIVNSTNVLNKVETVPGITNIATVVDEAIVLTNFSSPQELLLRGFDINQANNIYHFIPTIYSGRIPENPNETIVGRDLQKAYNLQLNDSLKVLYGFPSPRTSTLQIVGFYDLGVAAVNLLWAITLNSTVSEMFHSGTNITSINIQLSAPFTADTVAAQIQGFITDQNTTVTNWKAQNESLLTGLTGQSISSDMIQVFVLVAVVVGISSVLAITVLQKSKQIGILKAMGANDAQAAKVFLLQGVILGIGGAICGVLLGLFLIFSFVTFAVGANGQPIIALDIDPSFITLSACIAFLAAVISSLIPARKSSKLSPIEVIRNG